MTVTTCCTIETCGSAEYFDLTRLVVSELSRLGRSLGVSRLNGKEDDIRRFLELGVSKTAIAKITGVSRPTRYSSMSTRGLRTNP